MGGIASILVLVGDKSNLASFAETQLLLLSNIRTTKRSRRRRDSYTASVLGLLLRVANAGVKSS